MPGNTKMYEIDLKTAHQEGFFRANLFYCKGCGTCARECWTKAITMVEEAITMVEEV